MLCIIDFVREKARNRLRIRMNYLREHGSLSTAGLNPLALDIYDEGYGKKW
jgi:hypothetical protein